MLKSSEASKSPSNAGRLSLNWRAIGEFFAAVALLAIALAMALSSRSAMERGNTIPGTLLAIGALILAAITGILFIPKLARRVDMSRWRLPFSFHITREGGIFILVVFILSTAAINTGNNLLFIILATLLSTIVTSGLAARSSLSSIAVSMQVPENVFVGERVTIKVSLHNQKYFIPSFSIAVEDVGARAKGPFIRLWNVLRNKRSPKNRQKEASRAVLLHPAYFPFIPPRDSRSELVFQSFPGRGQYRLEGYQISTRFPFGLFQRGERFKAEGEVVVYPSIREVSAYFHLLPFLQGLLEGRQIGHGESLYAIRKYQDGESARIVDWKATAKTGVLMAREFARDEENKFCMILDTLLNPPRRPEFQEEFEKAVSFAASLAAHFSGEGVELEFLTPREYQPRGTGLQQLYRILRSLALAECENSERDLNADWLTGLSQIVDPDSLNNILSEKTFKIIITSRPRGSLPAVIWRSSHVIYFDEL